VKSSIAIAALLVAGLGVAAVAPTLAQSAPGSAAPGPTPPAAGAQVDPNLDTTAPATPRLFGARAMGPHRAMGPGALLMLACSPKGAEALDVTLLRLSYRLDITADQKPLFDAFREKALTTETSFADTCKTNAPQSADNAKPDFLARFKARLAVDQARLTALNDVLPSFEALYGSLSDTQKAALLPHRVGMGPGGQGSMGGMHHWRNGGGQGGPMSPSSQS
jgi:LTXXQ motif family protein